MEFRFCPACGVRAESGARFCTACGTPFVAPSGAMPTHIVGLFTLAVLLSVGGGFWLWQRYSPPPTRPLKPGEAAATASAPAPGSAGAPAAGAGSMAGGAAGGAGAGAGGGAGTGPGADHPPMELPAEIKSYISNLAKETEAKPTDAQAWQTLARVQYRASRLDPSYLPQAEKSFRKLLELDPKNLDALKGLANVHYDREERPQAIELYGKYLELKPDDPEVRTDLGTMLFTSGKPQEAIAEYRKVLATNPSFFQAYFNLGIVYDSLGDREAARSNLEKARELAPEESIKTRISTVLAQGDGASAGGVAPSAPPPSVAGAPAAGAASAGTAPSAPAAPAAAAGSMPPVGPITVSAGDAKTFPAAVENLFRSHSVVGPRIQKVEFPTAERGRVVLADFPMQSMPPFMRDSFLERMKKAVGESKTKFAVPGAVQIELVDAASGTVMATITP